MTEFVPTQASDGVDIDHGVEGWEPAFSTTSSSGPSSSSEIGCRALVVHAESDQARSFYRHLVPEFEDSPTDPLHLVPLTKDIRRTLTS